MPNCNSPSLAGVNVRQHYIRGCIERMFLFGVDPQVRRMLVHDALAAARGQFPASDGDASLRQPRVDVSRRSVYYDQYDQPGARKRDSMKFLFLFCIN